MKKCLRWDLEKSKYEKHTYADLILTCARQSSLWRADIAALTVDHYKAARKNRSSRLCHSTTSLDG
jgi:hypothetical protein